MFTDSEKFDQLWSKLNPASNVDLTKLFPMEHIDLAKVMGAQDEVQRLLDQVSAPAAAYQRTLDQMAADTSRAMQNIQNAILPQSAIALFQNLPLISDISKSILDFADALEAKDAEGRAILERGGHLYAADAVATYIVTELAGVEDEDLPEQLTELLSDVSTSEWFVQDLQLNISSSTLTAGRWRIVERGIELHKSGDFIASIPTLLPQVEGLLADALIIRSEAERDGTKLYRVNPKTGTREKTREGKDKEFPGLKSIVEHSTYQNSKDLENARDYVANFLCSKRNGILHGASTDYADQDTSVRIVLLVSAFAEAIARAESGVDV
ncbi:MAG: hypothetical protein WBA46_18800 [Thermomicrobiales bacterium]